jgi:release factor glutamine methyltransferase
MTTFLEIEYYFHLQLSELYDNEEIQNFYFLSCEHIEGLSRAQVQLNKKIILEENKLQKFYSIVSQLQQHKPIQYIFGETEFYGLKFLVNENVLIPRQETEELVHWLIQDYKNKSQVQILDIGTGSGCIPISLAHFLPQAKLQALDVSESALQLAAKNATLNNTPVLFHQFDILSNKFPESFDTVLFDCIVSNPPYIRTSEAELMHKNVLDFEPHLALFVTDDKPLLFYAAIANFAQFYLKKGGAIYFEINEALGKEVVTLLENKAFKDIVLKKDLNGKDRMVKAIK